MDKNLLIYYMNRAEDRTDDLAAALGIHPLTLRDKINCRTEFKQSEIEAIIRRYNLTPDEVFKVFFTEAEK